MQQRTSWTSPHSPEEDPLLWPEGEVRAESLQDLASKLGRTQRHTRASANQVLRHIPEEPVIDVDAWLAERGIGYKKDDAGRYVFLEPEERNAVPVLPEGYGYKGGAARSLLRGALHLPVSSPRDLDVVRISKEEPYPGADREISNTYMPEDFEHGHGVEILADPDAYFAERDLTINEVLTNGKSVIATEEAVRDTIEKRLSVTAYEKNRLGNTEKIQAKILRILAEETEHVVDDWDGPLEIGSFWLAVNLDRAMQRGRHVAEKFIVFLKKEGLLPYDIESPEEAAGYLVTSDSMFEFRNVTAMEQVAKHWEEMLYDVQEELSLKQKKRKKRGK